MLIKGGRIRLTCAISTAEGTIPKGSTGVITWIGDDICTVHFDNHDDSFGIDVRHGAMEPERVVPSVEITGGTIREGDWCYVKKINNLLNFYEGMRVQVKRIGLRVLVEFPASDGHGDETGTLELASAWLQMHPDEVKEAPSPYHLKAIDKGVFGDFSKIEEEIEELQDAKVQENPLLILCELADLLGAIEGYTLKHHNISLENLHQMTKLTRKAFESGHRT